LTLAPVTSVKAYDENINGLGIQRGIVTWAFNEETEEGTIKRFDIPQVGFAIVRLKSKNDTGLLPLDVAKQSVEPLIKNEKKAEIIRKKMKGSTLEVVSKSSGSTVLSAIGLSLANPVVPNLGFEPKVIGTALGLAPNKTSKLIDGNMGVYMVRAKTIVKAPVVKDYKSQIDQLNQQTKGGASYRVIQALRDKAEIKDNRGRL
jgi:peptidyl-prolyl cis-trans isomerase D